MAKIIGEAIKNIPWQDKPEGFEYPVWRYSGNPIITRDNLFFANSIFNSAVVPFGDGFAGVFRVDGRTRDQYIVTGFSKDAVNWELDEKIIFNGYDPRICESDGKYYLTWVNLTPRGTTIGVAVTEDFKTWEQKEDATYPVARNGVLFPRKINGQFMMLSRPSDTGHTPFGDIFLSRSNDLEYWGHHRFVMGTFKGDASAWQSTKIGPGPCPIETDEGWLLIYHGVLTTCNGFVYRMGAAILDIDDPSKVKYRTKFYILAPDKDYERNGDVPNVCFPCAALTDAATGRIAIYYGCADTVTGLTCERPYHEPRGKDAVISILKNEVDHNRFHRGVVMTFVNNYDDIMAVVAKRTREITVNWSTLNRQYQSIKGTLKK